MSTKKNDYPCLPIFYLFMWYFIPLVIVKVFDLSINDINFELMIKLSLPILFIGIIAKQTSWSIFGNNGIKGDSTHNKIEFSLNGKGSVKIYGDDLENKKELIEEMGSFFEKVLAKDKK